MCVSTPTRRAKATNSWAQKKRKHPETISASLIFLVDPRDPFGGLVSFVCLSRIVFDDLLLAPTQLSNQDAITVKVFSCCCNLISSENIIKFDVVAVQLISFSYSIAKVSTCVRNEMA